LDEEEWAAIRAADGGGQSPRPAFFDELVRRFPTAGKNGLEISRRFRHELPAHIAPDAAVVETLANLQSLGLPMAVLSNGSSAFQRAKLRACGAAPFFAKDQVLISGALGFAKPDPRAFAALAARLGVTAGEVLFIGNDPERDIAGALRAGMQACLVRVDEFPHLLDLSYFTAALPR
jgi:putative hydrolase of the HAD superfamily